jgi:diguanylate cyclase (GGDEF)-like protein
VKFTYGSLLVSARKVLFGAPKATLPRDQIIQALDDIITRSGNGTYTTTILVFEIDRFRVLEESRDGSEIAHILRVIEERLIDGPCRRHMIRRMGGGRFAIIPTPFGAISHEYLKIFAADIQNLATRPIRHPNRNTQITVSIGYAHQHETEATDGETLYEAANTALIVATKSGSNAICAFSHAIQSQITNNKNLARAAKKAMEIGDIHAHFQPQVDIVKQQVVGLEALARWQHSVRGMLSPAEFLPIIEAEGMMQDLGYTILKSALSALKHWDDAGIHIPTISVNMSTDELLNPHLVDIIAMELETYDLAPNRLVIEILETVVASTTEDLIMRNIADLHDLGCAIDLDDFGTGHASISTIRRFGVDRIKIDRSFVANSGDDKEQQQMVLAILTMSKQLNVDTLAEGVETDREMAFLSHAGCNVVQGYVVSRPMPSEDVANWMRTHHYTSAGEHTVQRAS